MLHMNAKRKTKTHKPNNKDNKITEDSKCFTFGKVNINQTVPSKLDIYIEHSQYCGVQQRGLETYTLLGQDQDPPNGIIGHPISEFAYSNWDLPNEPLNETEAKRVVRGLRLDLLNCVSEGMQETNSQLNEHGFCSIPFNQTDFRLKFLDKYTSDYERILQKPCFNNATSSTYIISNDLIRDSGKSTDCPPKDRTVAWLIGGLLTSGVGGIFLLICTIAVIAKMCHQISNLNNKLRGYEKLDNNSFSSDLLKNSMFSSKTLELKEQMEQQNIAWLNQIYNTDIFDKYYNKFDAQLKDQINTQQLNKRDYTHYGLDALQMKIVDVPVSLNNGKTIYDLFALLKNSIDVEDIKSNKLAINEYENYIEKCNQDLGLHKV